MGIWKFKLYLIKQLIIRDSQNHMKAYDFTTEGKKKKSGLLQSNILTIKQEKISLFIWDFSDSDDIALKNCQIVKWCVTVKVTEKAMTSVIVHEERELPGMQKAMKAKNASYLKRQSGFVYTLQPNMHGMASAILVLLIKGASSS